MCLLLDKNPPNGRRRGTDDGYSMSPHMKYAWYAYTRYIITLALEEKILSMTIVKRGLDDQPIRFSICIVGANANIYEQRNETEGCSL
jgi:hypothetical protein